MGATETTEQVKTGPFRHGTPVLVNLHEAGQIKGRVFESTTDENGRLIYSVEVIVNSVNSTSAIIKVDAEFVTEVSL